MSFKCGIVGLPNVGKSTLFNALTNSNKAQAENFPFCTIDPNIGVVAVPDFRLDNLAKISKSKKIINTTISFVDIAGLVKGASKGEGAKLCEAGTTSLGAPVECPAAGGVPTWSCWSAGAAAYRGGEGPGEARLR